MSLQSYAESKSKVYRRRQHFDLSNEGERVKFTLELYNLASSLDDERGDEGTEQEVSNLKEELKGHGKGLKTFTGKRSDEEPSRKGKRRANDDGGNQSESSRRKGGDGGVLEQL